MGSEMSKKMTNEEFKLLQKGLGSAKMRKKFKRSPKKLATAIIMLIENDPHANEDPADYANGATHWFQNVWNSISPDEKNLKKMPTPDTVLRDGDNEASYDGYNFYRAKCSTTACIAGWATQLAGYPMVIRTGWDTPSQMIERNNVYTAEFCQTGKGEVTYINNLATDLLGLEEDQRDWLFSAARKEPEVLWALRQIRDDNPGWTSQGWYDSADWNNQYAEDRDDYDRDRSL